MLEMKSLTYEQARRAFFSDMLKGKNRSLSYWLKRHDHNKCSDVGEEINYIEDAIKALDGDEDFGAICICAVRYTLGRQTYMPDVVQKFVKRHADVLLTNTLEIMRTDVRDADTMWGGYGDEKIDKPGWMRFMAFLDDEIKKRENKHE